MWTCSSCNVTFSNYCLFSSPANDIDYSAFLKLDGDSLQKILTLGQYLNFKGVFDEKVKDLDKEPDTVIEEPPAKRARLNNGKLMCSIIFIINIFCYYYFCC